MIMRKERVAMGKKIILLGLVFCGILICSGMAEAYIVNFFEQYTDYRYLGERQQTSYLFDLVNINSNSPLPTTDAFGYNPALMVPQSARLEFDIFAPDLTYERISFKLSATDGGGVLLWNHWFWLTPCNPTTTFSFNLQDYGFLDSLSDGRLKTIVLANGTPCCNYNDFAITRASLNVQAEATPEPMSMALFGLGLLTATYLKRRKT